MITLRLAEPKDLTEIQSLFVETIKAVCQKDYSPAQIKVLTASVEPVSRWQDKLKNQYFLLAQTAGKIVGFASLENADYLDFMYVHKDFQGKGIARQLYKAIETEVLKNGASMLSTDVSITAKPFFEKMGFDVFVVNYDVSGNFSAH